MPRILICSKIPNQLQIHYPILVQAIIGAGGVFVGTNPAYTPTELRHALETSLAKFIITEPELLQNIKQPAVALGISRERIFLTNHGDTNVQSTMRPWRTLLEHGQEDWSQFDDEEKSKTTNAMLLYVSRNLELCSGLIPFLHPIASAAAQPVFPKLLKSRTTILSLSIFWSMRTHNIRRDTQCPG